MKFIKKLFYGIVIIIMAGCIGVLVCAFNPELTGSVAEKLYGAGGILKPETAVPDMPDTDNSHVGSGILIPTDYIPPSEDAISLPEQVYGMSGYEPVRSNDKQLADEEAEKLQNTLAMGAIGSQYTFDTLVYPYYGMLDGDLQQLYRQIYANALELRKSFAPVIIADTQRVRDVFEAVYNDHPELFWLETEYSCKYNQKGVCLEITLKYNETAEDLETARKLFDAQAKVLVEGAKKAGTDYDREVYLHDALVKRVTYNSRADMNQSAYSALVNGESVCAGYARAFQYLMQQLAIPCYYCTGYSGEDHAWNIVKLGNNYYNTDVTWDDTKPATYDFFNKSDIDFAKTHVRKNLSVYLPACTGGNQGAVTDELLADGTVNEGLVNPNPQKPLRYPEDLYNYNGSEAEADRLKQENLDKAGITEEEVLADMKSYYADCKLQMVKAGTGQKHFHNVVPASLWTTVEASYGNKEHEAGYVTEALKELKTDHFAILLQVEDLSGGYYRIYHNYVTWDEPEADVSSGDVSAGDVSGGDVSDGDVSDGDVSGNK